MSDEFAAIKTAISEMEAGIAEHLTPELRDKLSALRVGAHAAVEATEQAILQSPQVHEAAAVVETAVEKTAEGFITTAMTPAIGPIAAALVAGAFVKAGEAGVARFLRAESGAAA